MAHVENVREKWSGMLVENWKPWKMLFRNFCSANFLSLLSEFSSCKSHTISHMGDSWIVKTISHLSRRASLKLLVLPSTLSSYSSWSWMKKNEKILFYGMKDAFAKIISRRFHIFFKVFTTSFSPHQSRGSFAHTHTHKRNGSVTAQEKPPRGDAPITHAACHLSKHHLYNT